MITRGSGRARRGLLAAVCGAAAVAAGAVLGPAPPVAAAPAAPAAPAPSLREVWQSPMGANYPFTVGGGHLYVLSAADGSPGATALDAATGRPSWTRPDLALWPVGVAGSTFVGIAHHDDGTTTAYGLDTSTGATRWSLPGHDQSGVVDASRFYLETYDQDTGVGALATYDATTGRLLWSRPATGPVLADGGTLFAVCGAQELECALDGVTGRLLWTNAEQYYGFPLKVTDGVLVSWEESAATGTQFLGVSTRTGRRLWTTPAVGNGQVLASGDFAAADGRVYFLTQDLPFAVYTPPPTRKARMWALDAATGRTVWSTALPGYYAGGFVAAATGVAVARCDPPNPVLAGDADNLCTLDVRTGRLISLSGPLDDRSVEGPLTDGRRFYFSGSVSEAWALRP